MYNDIVSIDRRSKLALLPAKDKEDNFNDVFVVERTSQRNTEEYFNCVSFL